MAIFYINIDKELICNTMKELTTSNSFFENSKTYYHVASVGDDIIIGGSSQDINPYNVITNYNKIKQLKGKQHE